MVDFPNRISPLAAVVERGTFGANAEAAKVEISERLPVSLMQVAAWPETFSDVQRRLSEFANTELAGGQTTTRNNGVTIMPSGQGRWLIESDDVQLENNLVKLLPDDIAAATGLTHGRVVVGVRDEKATWLLASGVELDFHLSAFPSGDVRMSHHHDIGLTIHRIGEDEFDLYLFTSFARPFWHWITKAASEVGYRVN